MILGVLHALFAFDNAPDDEELFFSTVKEGFGTGELGRWDNGDEADSHIEGTHHLVLRNLAEFAKMFKDRQHRPGAEFDLRSCALGQYARKIFGDAATGDVSHAVSESGGDEFLDHVQIAAVSLHQRGAGLFLD